MSNIVRSNCVQGFVFSDQGRYDKPYVFLHTPENVVSFLLAHPTERISIADFNYRDLLKTDANGQINADYDQRFFDEISPILASYKDGKQIFHPLAFTEFASEHIQNEIIDQLRRI